MHAEFLFDHLARQTLLFSVGVVLVGLLRLPLLRSLGARATYLSWLMVPLLMLSPCLPQPPLGDTVLAVPASLALPAAMGHTLPALQSAVAPAPSAAVYWLLVWGLGGALLATAQWALQRRYLGRLQRTPHGRWLAPAGASPAVVGLWPQRLVLPRDFKQRFDARARRLVLAHEAVHARRHDNAWNLLGAALLCLQWFNPLAWWAWRRMRDDQELACDAAVLSAEMAPAPVAAYAQAMLYAHPAHWQPALTSGWASRHPLVQRMRLLMEHGRISRRRQLAGLTLLVGLGAGTALVARAVQTPPPPQNVNTLALHGLSFDLASQLGGESWTHRRLHLPPLRRPAGRPWHVYVNQPQPGWCLAVRLDGFEDGSMRPTGQVLDDTCQRALGDWQVLKVNGGLVQFVAETALGPLQAQLSARWVRPDDPALAALRRTELESAPKLSPAQVQQMAQRRAHAAEMTRQLEAQDRAWRAAREPQ
ncbi:MAG TPA: M56 family metallopeptidase [Roseateles sp.]